MTTIPPVADDEAMRIAGTRLRDLATKEYGVGMSYQACGVSGGAELRLYGKRAEAAYWLLSNGHSLADALSLPMPTVDREAIARKLCEQHGGDPDAVASEEHDCWEGPLWTVFVKEADAILALLHPIDDIGSGGAE